MLKNNTILNKIFNFKYSNEFIERMLTEDLYCVCLSCYPYILPKYIDETGFRKIKFNFNSPSYFHPEHSIIHGYHNSFEDTTPLIVKTGESLQYVRELLTDEKIPIAYYDIDLDDQCAKLSLYDKNGQSYPYYIKAFRSYYMACYGFNLRFEDTGFSNFNDECKLSNFSSDRAESILQSYQELDKCDGRTVESFRKQLLQCFTDAEEYMKDQILQEQQKQQQDLEEAKQKKKLIGSYFQ